MGSRAMFIDAISFVLPAIVFFFSVFVSGTCQLLVMMMNWIFFLCDADFAFFCLYFDVLPPLEYIFLARYFASIGIKDISIWSIGKLRQIYWINKLVSFIWQ